MRCRSLLGLLALLLAPRAAHAFAESSAFFDDPLNPHGATLGAVGEGVYFTGAPRFAGLGCVSCHNGGPQQLAVRIGALPEGLFSDGYQPGQTYELSVELSGATAGSEFSTATCTAPPTGTDKYTYVPCDHNNFALEVDASTGPLSGPAVFCAGAPVAGVCPMTNPFTDETVVPPAGDAVFGNILRDPANPKTITLNGPTSWHLYFTAPASGTGPLTLYLGAVDGNGGDGTASNDQDVRGDDTVSAVVPLREADLGASLDAIAGCSVASPTGHGPGLGGALLLGLLWLWRRRSAARCDTLRA